MLKPKHLFLLYILCPLLGFSEGGKSEDLLGLWRNIGLEDANRLKSLDQWILNNHVLYPDSCLLYIDSLISHAGATGGDYYLARGFEHKGVVHSSQGAFETSFEAYQSALNIYEVLHFENEKAHVLARIGHLKWNEGNYPQSIDYYERSNEIVISTGDSLQWADNIRGIAYSYYNQGLEAKALHLVRKSYEISLLIDDIDGISWCLNAFGVFYKSKGETSKSLDYYIQGMKLNEEIGDEEELAFSLSNIGETYLEMGQLDLAMDYFQRSLLLDRKNNNRRGLSYRLAYLGRIHYLKAEYALAKQYMEESLEVAESIGVADLLRDIHEQLGSLHYKLDEFTEAEEHCLLSLHFSKASNSLDGKLKACECLYLVNKAQNSTQKSFEYLELVLGYKDSIGIVNLSEELQQMEFAKKALQDSINYEEEERLIKVEHEKEVSQNRKTRNYLAVSGTFFLLLAFASYGRSRYIKKAKSVLQVEKDRSEKLLLNILPQEIAHELKEKGEAEAKLHSDASILFTDFKGFTKASEKLSPSELVHQINVCFKAFDQIVDKWQLEKIKTIGDAYMAVGGIPHPSKESLKNTVMAALEMQAFIISQNAHAESGDTRFEMRAGIHIGQVVAGIVGTKKFQYDIWGDAVNTASRMESSGEVGRVNISKKVYLQLQSDPEFIFESRPPIEVKGKGEMEMYFVALKIKK